MDPMQAVRNRVQAAWTKKHGTAAPWDLIDAIITALMNFLKQCWPTPTTATVQTRCKSPQLLDLIGMRWKMRVELHDAYGDRRNWPTTPGEGAAIAFESGSTATPEEITVALAAVPQLRDGN